MKNAHSDTRLRVLMVLSYFYPFRAGAENQALLLSEALRRRGLDVFVLTRFFKGLASRESIRGVPVYRFIKTLDVRMLFSLCYIFFSFVFMVMHRKRYDVIHCHILQGFHSSVAVIMGRMFKKKTVIKLAGSGTTSDFAALARVVCAGAFLRLLRRADRLVATSTVSAREALQQGFSREQVVLIPNGVDARRFRPREGYADSRSRIVYVGRLIAGKGIEIVIDAFAQLRRDFPRLRLDIVGDGPERNSLAARAEELACRDGVVFHGEADAVERFFDNTCIFAQPSLSEGMSNVILEAMAAGLPVVASRTGAAPDVIRDGENGLLVEADSAAQLRDALQRIVSDEALARRLGTNARQTIEDTYAIDIVAEQYMELYRGLAAS